VLYYYILSVLLKSNRGNECSNKFVVKQAVALSLSLFFKRTSLFS
jgi:hypothetical protein